MTFIYNRTTIKKSVLTLTATNLEFDGHESRQTNSFPITLIHTQKICRGTSECPYLFLSQPIKYKLRKEASHPYDFVFSNRSITNTGCR